MNRPTARIPFTGDHFYYDAKEADAYMDALEAELTQLRTEIDRLKVALERISTLDFTNSATNFAAYDAFRFANAALTQRKPRGQQIWPPVVDSANDSREGGDDE